MHIGRDDWNSKLVTYFVKNNRLVLLIIIAIVAGGIFSLFSLRREAFPQVQPKVVGINTIYPGASAKDVESQVTKIIESAVKDADNVKDVSSTSTSGFSSVVVNFDQTADLDLAVQNIRNKTNSIANQLPEDSQDPQVQTFSTGGPDFIVGIIDDNDLDNLVVESKIVVDNLEEVRGIKQVQEINKREIRVVIRYNNDILAANGLTINQVEQIISGNNVDFPLARLDINRKSQSIVAQGSFGSVEDLENLVVGLSKSGKPLFLRDVAQVEKETETIEKIQRVGVLNGKKLESVNAILLQLTITKDADILAVKERLDDKISEIKDDGLLKPQTKIKFLLDNSDQTKEQINEIIAGAVGDSNTFYLLGGLQLVLLAMLLFVNWRAALIAASAIPISFLFTLLWLYLVGVQLNTIVLFSLILVLGLIVDPAIVVLESIQRYKDLARSGVDSVIETGRRYGAGLFIAVLTSIIVFIPFGIVSGIFGEIIKYIPITVVPALIASYFVPIALLPALAVRFLKGKVKGRVQKEENEDLWPAAVYMMRFNSWVLQNNLRKVAVLIAMVVLIGLSSTFIVRGLIPIVQFSSPADAEFLSVTLKYPKGTTFKQRDEISQRVEKNINDRLGVENYLYVSQDSDQAIIYLTLQKKRDPDDSSKKIVSRLEDAFESVEGVEITTDELSVGPPESEYQIQAQLFANDLTELEKAAKDVGKYLSEKTEVEKVDDGFTDKSVPQILILLDKDRLASFGLSVFEVDQTLKSYLDEKKISKFNDVEKDESFEIYLKPETSSLPTSKEEISALTIYTRSGQDLPLSALAKIEETSVLDVIERYDGKRFVNVKARLKDQDDLIKVQTDLDNYLSKDKLESLKIDSTGNKGEFEEIAKSFQELFIALVAAIFLTYIVLVLQFGSFSQPVIMLFTIPLAAVGVFPALYLVGGQLGFLEILGFTILVGIVENVAIFLIDYANQLVKEKNMSLKEAIILSSGVRFRPIILTKVVALGGLLPLAIFSPFWRGLSSVIIGGILVSGFLSMTVIPIFYTWFGALRVKVHRFFG